MNYSLVAACNISCWVCSHFPCPNILGPRWHIQGQPVPKPCWGRRVEYMGGEQPLFKVVWRWRDLQNQTMLQQQVKQLWSLATRAIGLLMLQEIVQCRYKCTTTVTAILNQKKSMEGHWPSDTALSSLQLPGVHEIWVPFIINAVIRLLTRLVIILITLGVFMNWVSSWSLVEFVIKPFIWLRRESSRTTFWLWSRKLWLWYCEFSEGGGGSSGTIWAPGEGIRVAGNFR